MNFQKIKSEIISLAGLVLVIFAFKSSFIANYTVPTSSMVPTIEPGDKLIVNKMAYDFRIPFTKIRLFNISAPKRGEVIVFESPVDPSMNYIKRLIGLPGDLLEVRDGVITINGESLKLSVSEEDLQRIIAYGGAYSETLGEKTYTVRRVANKHTPSVSVRIPEDSYFAMGDNREESADSRYWGFVPKENLWGKAKFIYFSFDWNTFKFHWDRIGTTF